MYLQKLYIVYMTYKYNMRFCFTFPTKSKNQTKQALPKTSYQKS